MARSGRSVTGPHRSRTVRSRARPHGRSGLPQPGHASARRARATRAAAVSKTSIIVHPASLRGSRTPGKRQLVLHPGPRLAARATRPARPQPPAPHRHATAAAEPCGPPGPADPRGPARHRQGAAADQPASPAPLIGTVNAGNRQNRGNPSRRSTAMPGAGIPLGDILADSGYAHRDADAWAIPLRQAGAQLIQDLHPSDRGPKGTHHGAIIANGNLYCPKTPRLLLELGPLPPAAAPDDIAAHDQQTAELATHKLGRITADDADGYHRVMCPAVMGKIRCPLRPESMTLDRRRPEILTPPASPPACCAQQTITVPPDVTAKTRQKHDYPSKEHRHSYARRTGSERTFSTIKDPATTTIARGWCRLMGVTPLALWIACLLAVRNQRILAAWDTRQAGTARRAALGQPPRTRKRRRKTLASLAAGPP